MYKIEFISDTGVKFLLGADNGIVFDADALSGLEVDLGTSQGFSQMGQTVETRSVSGAPLQITGKIFRNIPAIKAAMRRVFAPFRKGKLIFNGTHYLQVEVKSSPAISPIRDNGAFSLELFAPFPFWRSVQTSTYGIGVIEPLFSFPVTYSSTEPHEFGSRSSEKFTNIINDGDVPTAFSLSIRTTATSTNTTITNVLTGQFLRVTGTLNIGEVVEIARDSSGQLSATLTADGVTTDIISRVDDDSNLYELAVGDNIMLVSDDEASGALIVNINFDPAFGGVYEN